MKLNKMIWFNKYRYQVKPSSLDEPIKGRIKLFRQMKNEIFRIQNKFGGASECLHFKAGFV